MNPETWVVFAWLMAVAAIGGVVALGVVIWKAAADLEAAERRYQADLEAQIARS